MKCILKKLWDRNKSRFINKNRGESSMSKAPTEECVLENNIGENIALTNAPKELVESDVAKLYAVPLRVEHMLMDVKQLLIATKEDNIKETANWLIKLGVVKKDIKDTKDTNDSKAYIDYREMLSIIRSVCRYNKYFLHILPHSIKKRISTHVGDLNTFLIKPTSLNGVEMRIYLSNSSIEGIIKYLKHTGVCITHDDVVGINKLLKEVRNTILQTEE